MITSRSPVRLTDVAAHYNELDTFYREVWGEHVHHGLWTEHGQSVEQATRALIDEVANRAQVKPGDHVCDVGCGYGGTARVLAQEYGASVTGLTISRAQQEHAQSLDPGSSNPQYLVRDWLENRLESDTFDVVIAIESSEHMPDLRLFFTECARVLAPGGRLVICTWLTCEQPNSWERRFLLEPICREGRLVGMGSRAEYEQLAIDAGLRPLSFQDLSARVKRTWTICAARVARGLLEKPSYRQFLLSRKSPNKVFAMTLLRIRLAYQTGSMRYGMMTAEKPVSL